MITGCEQAGLGAGRCRWQCGLNAQPPAPHSTRTRQGGLLSFLFSRRALYFPRARAPLRELRKQRTRRQRMTKPGTGSGRPRRAAPAVTEFLARNLISSLGVFLAFGRRGCAGPGGLSCTSRGVAGRLAPPPPPEIQINHAPRAKNEAPPPPPFIYPPPTHFSRQLQTRPDCGRRHRRRGGERWLAALA